MTLTCPDCKLELPVVSSGSIEAHRCARCRGIWLDPDAFRRVCEEESSAPGEEEALARPGADRPRRSAPPTDDRVRYRACPVCADVMSRTNFGKVSGVVIDVCRPHGAWFDRGELAAIRRFLRAGGLRRYEQSRALERERTARQTARARLSPPIGRLPDPRNASIDDVYDVLMGGDRWDVPSRIPRLPMAAVFAALGAWALWSAFDPIHYDRSYGAGGVVLGLVSLWFAWRALGQWAARRRR